MSICKRMRCEIYEKVFAFMLDMDLFKLPTPIDSICYNMQIELKPLSTIKQETNWDETTIFGLWGNENGHLMQYQDKNGLQQFKIAYNDNPNHMERKRFTIAEEIMHCVLKHYENDIYSVLHNELDENIYSIHDECARIGAGLLLCPPPIFYESEFFFNIEGIQLLCQISKPCAEVRYDILNKFKNEIQQCNLYWNLFNNYNSFIETLDYPYLYGEQLIT